jgi:hypothetical protein
MMQRKVGLKRTNGPVGSLVVLIGRSITSVCCNSEERGNA